MLSVFGWRVAQVGGNLNNGSKAGLSYFNVNNDSSNDNSNIGAQLSIVKKQQSIMTMALAEKYESLIDQTNRVIFTSSLVLRRQLEKHEKELPFLAKIVRINNYYSLS